MMLLRQLPTGSMSMSMPSMSFSWSSLILPSNSSILLSLLASLVVLSFVRAALLCLRTNVAKQSQQQIEVQGEGKEAEPPRQQRQQRLSWAWGLFTWDSLPTVSLPVSLTMVESDSNGRGVGMQRKPVESMTQRWQPTRSKRGGPAFETPLPALYQSDMPVSMAKMIMSRHTYRKPTNRPPARTVPPPTRLPVPSPASSSSHPPSMTKFRTELMVNSRMTDGRLPSSHSNFQFAGLTDDSSSYMESDNDLWPLDRPGPDFSRPDLPLRDPNILASPEPGIAFEEYVDSIKTNAFDVHSQPNSEPKGELESTGPKSSQDTEPSSQDTHVSSIWTDASGEGKLNAQSMEVDEFTGETSGASDVHMDFHSAASKPSALILSASSSFAGQRSRRSREKPRNFFGPKGRNVAISVLHESTSSSNANPGGARPRRSSRLNNAQASTSAPVTSTFSAGPGAHRDQLPDGPVYYRGETGKWYCTEHKKRSFSSLFTLQRHLSSSSGHADVRYVCPFCEKPETFTRKDGMYRHIAAQHC
ncbi:hypothetical protein D9615_003457 [Tricholomella constricta]|uniref:Uncharacterized protein n=1 Tax=Tricholomella constricta TaxID=117010 RepID=A0A8H5HJ22_9AGAR|nr:hypothetical protein D9615_003457 [Tricholomella constricta]